MTKHAALARDYAALVAVVRGWKNAKELDYGRLNPGVMAEASRRHALEDAELALLASPLPADTAEPATKKCPTCDSPAPHLHPAVRHECDVQVCRDPFHATVTTENTAERIARVGLQEDQR